jgi:RecA-family ATPase
MIPRRKVTLLVGEQEMGKSFFALDLAARLTRGESIPPAPPLDDGPASVLILEGDDESDDTLVPRLEDAGADLARVYTLTVDGPKHCGEGRPQISLAHSTDCLLRTVRLLKDCRLIIIDPITAFIDGMSANSHDAVRRLFQRLTVIAKLSDAAVLLITHNRKAGADSTLHRTIGCMAFTIAARVVFTIVENPSVAGSRFLLPAKMNLQAPSECKGRSFCIHNHEIHWDVDPINLRPDELKALAASGLATCDRLSQTVLWLRDLLANGRVPSREIHEQAAKQAIPRVLLYKAKAKAGARVIKDGVNRRWCWELIPEEPESNAPQPPQS